jgi:hypothetical protein
MKSEIFIPEPTEQKETFPALYAEKRNPNNIWLIEKSEDGLLLGHRTLGNNIGKCGNCHKTEFYRLPPGTKITLTQE